MRKEYGIITAYRPNGLRFCPLSFAGNYLQTWAAGYYYVINTDKYHNP